VSNAVVISTPYTLGEIPPPLSYTFLDSTGAAIDLFGYQADFSCQEHDGSPFGGSASVSDPTNGVVTYIWTGAEFATAGRYTAYLWCGNGTQRYASVPIQFTVQLPVGAVPEI
jgi:hypothetical protein